MISPTTSIESPATTPSNQPPVSADAPYIAATSPVTTPDIPSTPANTPDIFPYGRGPVSSSAPATANLAPETAEVPAGAKSASKFVQHDLLCIFLILVATLVLPAN
ncbi:unnamed protein product [Arabidopsis thaliana]|uniref:(thale cress) hypothetical protein n=1 Tax=Arabidopsis thaliana TaxID=3702 RepID=A0A7G2FGH6_ARATH|nr:unnamed protein product [Arabidopsis thaliana]